MDPASVPSAASSLASGETPKRGTATPFEQSFVDGDGKSFLACDIPVGLTGGAPEANLVLRQRVVAGVS